ncbi:MAG TPA: hypothetical protein VKS60_20805 [Stellaceae bacterium]|nr:hypothetical protein [Stellaceae bacterium]
MAGFIIDKNIIGHQKFVAEGEYNVPVVIKGRDFYATDTEAFYHDHLLVIFIALFLLGVALYGILAIRGRN